MKSHLIVYLLLTILVCGCDSKSDDGDNRNSLPVVNAENCKPENIRKISPKDAQEQFSSMCLRGGRFKPSVPQEW